MKKPFRLKTMRKLRKELFKLILFIYLIKVNVSFGDFQQFVVLVWVTLNNLHIFRIYYAPLCQGQQDEYSTLSIALVILIW